MAEFGVGRSTVREVLVRLASDGIISLVRHSGAKVRRLTRGEVRELLDLVEVMLGLAARRAAEAAGDGSLEDVRQMLTESASADDLIEFAAARELFYRRIVERSGNHELARTFPSALVRIMRLQLAPFGRAAEGMDIASYEAIADAIRDRDPAAAEAAAWAHVRRVQQAVDAVPARAFAIKQL